MTRSWIEGSPEIALKNTHWFVLGEDRFSMQSLADLIRDAIRHGVLSYDDLLTTGRRRS